MTNQQYVGSTLWALSNKTQCGIASKAPSASSEHAGIHHTATGCTVGYHVMEQSSGHLSSSTLHKSKLEITKFMTRTFFYDVRTYPNYECNAISNIITNQF